MPTNSQLIEPSSFLPALAAPSNNKSTLYSYKHKLALIFKMNTAKRTFITFILLAICTYSFFWHFLWSCNYRNCPEQSNQRVLGNLNEAAQSYWSKLSMQQSDLLSDSSSDFGIGQDDKRERERQFLRDVMNDSGDVDDNDEDDVDNGFMMRHDSRHDDKVPMNNVSKVLLLTMGRSGSSFVGDLLTLNPKSTYIYEPLRPLQWPWKDSFLGDWTQDGLDKIVANIMGVFKCDPQWLTRKVTESACLRGDPIVSKVIRLRYPYLLEWSRRESLDWLKVVHLVRDPRARYLSIQSEFGTKAFFQVMSHFNESCRWMLEDQKVRQLVKPQNYKLVRYEDVTEDPMSVLRDLYAFMETNFGVQEELAVLEHTQAETRDKDLKTNHYYSTYRTKDFDPNRWRRSLHLDDIRMVEEACSGAMQAYNYTIFDPDEEKQRQAMSQLEEEQQGR